MAALDSKYHGVLFKNKDQTKLDPAEYIVFLAKDNALLDTLTFYRKRLAELGADTPQLIGVDQLIIKVRQWRSDHPDKCKIPDLDPKTEGH